MATNFEQQGERLTVTASGTVTSGDFIVIGSMFGVALTSAANNEPVVIRTGGVWHDLPKTEADEPSIGDLAYWDGSAVTTSADDGDVTDYLKIGVFMAAGVNGDKITTVRLNSSF